MRQTERHREIKRILDRKPAASVDDLCELLEVSPATVRRDLKALAASGDVRRFHGGAEPASGGRRLQGTPFARNLTTNVQQKKAIAQVAAALCDEGESLIVDAGTTTYFMCPHLNGRDLQVLTNSIPVVDQLIGDASVRLHVPGGEIYREQNIILSPFEHDGVSQYAASKMFIGAGALSRRGLLQVDSILIQAEKRLLARAEELIVLADSSKFVATASLILCGLDRIDRVVTDDGIPEEARLYLERAGIAVQIVDA